MRLNHKPDVLLHRFGTLVVMSAKTERARRWLQQNIRDQQVRGDRVVVETRFAPPIVEGMVSARPRLKVEVRR